MKQKTPQPKTTTTTTTTPTTQETGKFTETTGLISTYNIASLVKPEFVDTNMRLYHWMTKELYPSQWKNLINNQMFDEKTQKLMMVVLNKQVTIDNDGIQEFPDVGSLTLIPLSGDNKGKPLTVSVYDIISDDARATAVLIVTL